MSIQSGQTLDRDTLNRAYISKSATGTQIMAGSLRLLGGITIDGVTALGTVTTGAITTTGTITATTFSGAHSGSGASLTTLNGSNISSGTVADARLSTNVVLLNKAQTFTANNTYSATANLYFAGGTTYKIDTAGSAYFNALQVAGNVTLDGNDYITFGSAGVAAPSDTSTGTKIKLFGNSYQLGIETSSIWYDSANNHRFYTNNGTATRTLRAEVTDLDTHIFTDLNVDKNLEVAGEFKAGINNEYPDPLLVSGETSLWGATSNGTLVYDNAQAPVGTGAVGSVRLTASAADAFVYSVVRFDVSPSEWITYSAYAFATTASKSADIYIQWLDASSTHISYSGSTFPITTAWARYRLTAQAPANARYAKIRIGNQGGTGAVMYFSAFQIERGKTLTGFKPYQGGKEVSLMNRGLYLPSGGEIYSGHNSKFIIKDHSNGNVTLSAAGSNLYLGYQNTVKVLLNAPLYGSNATTQIAGTDGTLYYQGVDTDTRYINVAGDTMTGALTMGANSIIGSSAGSWINLGTTPTFSTVSSLVIHADSDNSSTTEYVSIKAGVDELKVVSDGTITFNANKVWHAGNDGAGSTLDADTVDGIHGTQLLRKDVSDAMSGSLTIANSGNALSLKKSVAGAGNLWLNFRDTANAEIAWIGYGGANDTLTMSNSLGEIVLSPGNGIAKVGASVIWHAGNDGAGSGLDADTVDGVQLSGLVQTSRNVSTSTGLTGGGNLSADRTLAFDTTWGDGRYLGKTAKAADSEKLDNLDSSQFLRSDTSDTFTGTLTLNGKLDVTGGVETDSPNYLTAVPGTHREGGKINLLSRINGRILNRNPDFINSTMTGYSTYDNNSSGRVIASLVTDDTVPNANGKVMRISYDPARSATAVTPGFGGFKTEHSRDTADLSSWSYRAGNRYIHRIVAYIPTGRNINFVSNSTGDGGGGKWLTPTAGTNNWQEYVYLETIGNTGTFSSTGFYYINGGADAAFTWDVSICQIIGIDEVPDVDRAPNLNVGYKPGVDVGWGEVYSTGKITTDNNIEAKGDYILNNSKYIKSTGGNSYLTLFDGGGNFHLRSNEGTKSMFLDSDLMYIRNSAGVSQITVGANGDTTIVNNLTVSKSITATTGITATGITVAKSGNISTITFPAGSGGNDPAYISHEETTANTGKMFFVASDDANDVDYFGFGSTTQKENAKITTAGNATFKATSVTNLAVSGDLSIATTATDKAALSIGAVTIGQNTANASELIITNLSELRFGSTTNATWDYSKWGGIKYITGSNTMVIGGPASANFAAGSTPPRIKVNFEGLSDANFDGKVVINDAAAGTIGGTTMANGWLQIGTGLSMDPNEIYFSGTTGIIGTIGAYDLSFQPGGTSKMVVSSNGVSVTGSIVATGELSGTKITASGGVSVPLSGSIHIGTFGDSAASLRLHYNGSGYVDFGGDLYFRSGTTERMRLSAAGNLGIKTTPHASYGISTDSIIVSNWVRTTGSTGWYNETYAGGWNMTDSTWIRNFGTKSVFIAGAGSALRTEGKLEVGAGTSYTAAADFQVVAGASGTFNYRNVLYSDGTKVGIGAASATHPLDVHTGFGAQGINIQTTDDALTNGLSFQNSAGTYSWQLARNGTGVSPDLVLYGGSNATLSSLAERVRFKNAGGMEIKGTVSYDDVNRYWLSTATNWGLYFNTTDNKMEYHGGGTNRFSVDLDDGATWVGGALSVAGTSTLSNRLTLSMDRGENPDYSAGHLELKNATSGSTGDIVLGFHRIGLTASSLIHTGDTWGSGQLALTGTSAAGRGTLEVKRINYRDSTAKAGFSIEHNLTEDSLDFVYNG